MKKTTILLSILLISLSSYSQQTEFDNVLGKTNVSTLNLLLKEFETETLKQEYPNFEIGIAYKKFLKDTKNDYRKSFKNNNLKLQIYCIPDSIWKDNEVISGKKRMSIKTRYKCLNSKNEIIYSSSYIYCCKDEKKTEKMIEQAKKDVQVNMSGLFIKALENISEKTEFIEEYLNYIKTTADPIPNYLISNYIEKNKIDTNDYLVKRIIFINSFYR